jgi:membrane-associated phospholipid phosphatase
MLHNKKYLAIGLAGLLVLGLSFLFAITDYDIFVRFSNQESAFGNVMEILGELLAPYLFALSGIILSLYYHSQPEHYKKRKLKIFFSNVCMVVGILYSILIFSRLNDLLYSVTGIVFTGIGFTIAILQMKKITPERLFQLYCIALTAIVYMLSALILINILKFAWGRVRPRQLADIADFTPWYHPQGFSKRPLFKYRSFPSGHTANASILYIITMFAPLTKKRWLKFLLYVIPIVWIIIMAASRVIVGAHFASDVLFGATISIILFYLSRHYTLQYIKKSLE